MVESFSGLIDAKLPVDGLLLVVAFLDNCLYLPAETALVGDAPLETKLSDGGKLDGTGHPVQSYSARRHV